MAEKIASLQESLGIVPGRVPHGFDSLTLAGEGYSSGASSTNAVATLNKRELTKVDIECARLLDAWLLTAISYLCLCLCHSVYAYGLSSIKYPH